MLRRLLIISSLLVGPIANAETRDHEPDMHTVASYSWQLADDSEAMSHATQQYNWQIARAANDLHMEASDVYHLANDPFRDHDHDQRIRQEFYDVQRAYQTLAWYAGYHPTRDHVLDSYMRRIDNDYRNLYYAVWGTY